MARSIQKTFAAALLAAAIAFLFFPAASLPVHAQFPCFSGADCPPHLNPEPDEYYTVQCTTNAVWLWRSVPAPEIASTASFYQLLVLAEGASLPGTFDVTYTRSGDTITASGANGNRAPEPGEKSFSWSECIARNGGLPPGLDVEPPSVPGADQLDCLGLADEHEVVACLADLENEDENDAANSCADLLYRADNLDKCVQAADTSLGVIFRLVEICRFPGALSLAFVSFSAFRPRRRKRR